MVLLEGLAKEYDLEVIHMPDTAPTITNVNTNRPAMQIAGFFDYYDPSRIQVWGFVEDSYSRTLKREVYRENLEKLFSLGMPALITTRNIQPCDRMIQLAEQYNIPLLRTESSSSALVRSMSVYLDEHLAPSVTIHGVLVEIFSTGVLIIGDSGIGKSETALSLLRRNHRLVADDAVEIRRLISNKLIGSAPKIIQNFMEIRGIGIIDIRKMFGASAVKEQQQVDLVVSLVSWDKDKDEFDRTGMNVQYHDVIGRSVPKLTIPVRPGRNLVDIIEVAAINNVMKDNKVVDEINSRIG